MAKDPDEKVDGPKVAAQILSSMRASDRERIVSAMKEKAPELTVRVEANLFTFEDIADLTPQGLQLLLSEIPQPDLTLALKRASTKLQTIFFANMTDRKCKSVKEDLITLPPQPIKDVEDAQQRILKRLDELRTAGRILTQGKHDVWV